jgi:hypothetical protein
VADQVDGGVAAVAGGDAQQLVANAVVHRATRRAP